MEKTPTLEDARESLTAHVAAKGAEIRAKHGPVIGWPQLLRILADRECVRYPCKIAFDASPLQPGECAFPEPLGPGPGDGFRLCVHPYFSTDPTRVPALALYQVVAINYGAFASPDDAEVFGAAVLGIPREQYYSDLCAMADEISADDPALSRWPTHARQNMRTKTCAPRIAHIIPRNAEASRTDSDRMSRSRKYSCRAQRAGPENRDPPS
jgi:hypothetical protein